MKRSASYPFALKNEFIPSQTRIHNFSSLQNAYLFIFYRGKILVTDNDGKLNIPTVTIGQFDHQNVTYRRFMGMYCNTPCYIMELTDITLHNKSFPQMNLRELFGTISDDLFSLAGKALQILSWHQENKFCGKCGAPMTEHKGELAKQCTACEFIVYPRISPVVIMTIEKDDTILLGRSPHFPKGMYSPLAGFVEAGETLEEAVIREIQEEVGITICNISYAASQPWPFPHSLMIGFRTKYSGGKISIDTNEIEDARWFHVDNLPVLPSPISLSRHLLNLFLDEHGK
jgi:NAD+ diphosphatase